MVLFSKSFQTYSLFKWSLIVCCHGDVLDGKLIGSLANSLSHSLSGGVNLWGVSLMVGFLWGGRGRDLEVGVDPQKFLTLHNVFVWNLVCNVDMHVPSSDAM